MNYTVQSANRSFWYLLITDYLIVVGTFAVVMRLRFRPHIDIIDIAELHIIPQVLFAFFYAFAFLILFGVIDMYKRKLWISHLWHTVSILKGVGIGVVGYVILQYFSKSSMLMEHRSVTVAWGAVLFLALYFHRVVVFPFLRKFISRSDWRRRVVIIGASDVGKDFAEACLAVKNDNTTLKIIGFLDDNDEVGKDVVSGLRILGSIPSLRDNVDLYKIEGAVITATDLTYQRLMDIIEECVRLFGWVEIHTEKADCLQQNLNTDSHFEIPFIRMRSVSESINIKIYKRLMDVCLASAGMLLLAPVYLLTALFIKLSSPGPVIYTSERIGYKGVPFKFYKFRSMKVGADQDAERKKEIETFITDDEAELPSKIVNLKNTFFFGRFIRKWGIDELPQLFNVIKGDMSMVGPRPSPIDEYNVNADWQKKRFEAKPGCTGLWKLYASKNKTTNFSQTVLYDIYYIRNMNPLFDLYIILGTIRVILTGKADT